MISLPESSQRELSNCLKQLALTKDDSPDPVPVFDAGEVAENNGVVELQLLAYYGI